MKHIRKFDINKSSKKPGKKNCYEIIVDFMVGDADGEEKLKFKFTEDQMKDPVFQEYVSDFIESIEGCIELDAIGYGWNQGSGQGRVGFDDEMECSEWYAGGFDRCDDQHKGVPSWSRFCNIYCDVDEEDLPLKNKKGELVDVESYQQENNPFSYSIPRGEMGYYCSYEAIEMYYYDSNGEKFEVNIKINSMRVSERELKLINWVADVTISDIVESCLNGISGGMNRINYKPNDGIFDEKFVKDVVKTNQGDNDFDHELGNSGWSLILENINILAKEYLKFIDKNRDVQYIIDEGGQEIVNNIKKSLQKIADKLIISPRR